MTLRYIGYAELNEGNDYPQLKKSLEAAPYSNKSEIVSFLLNGNVKFVRMSRSRRDIFTGETIHIENLIMNDGEYYWSNVLAYYVEKYNLRLPEDFENYILGKSKFKS